MILTPALGPKAVVNALSALDVPGRLFSLSLTELEALRLPAHSAQFLFDGEGRRAAEAELARVAGFGGSLIGYSSPLYPERLREIYDAPPVLWLRGDPSLLSRPSLAVVGTRHPSAYGSAVAERISRDLAARNLLIVSGMARGIDSCAHRGALQARRPTLAVWGTGIDVVYPKENAKLCEEILAQGGTIVSEQPMGSFAAPQNFPLRNRILSGLSLGVLVVEASENSGTRVTARCAAEQSRDLYAVPGNVTSRYSWTPNTLIKQGAKLVATWEDVWEDLSSQIRLELEDLSRSEASAAPENPLATLAPLRPEEAIVLETLRCDEARSIDDLLESVETQLTSAEVFTALFELELAGRIRCLPGKNYVRTL